METLSYGVKKPQTGDKGSVFFPALEDDLEQLNDHNHNGTNSEKLTGSSVTAVKQNIANSGWASHGSDGGFRQLVTMPGTMLFDDYLVLFKDQATGKKQILLEAEKVSSNTYYVYCNDDSLSITAYYLS